MYKCVSLIYASMPFSIGDLVVKPLSHIKLAKYKLDSSFMYVSHSWLELLGLIIESETTICCLMQWETLVICNVLSDENPHPPTMLLLVILAHSNSCTVWNQSGKKGFVTPSFSLTHCDMILEKIDQERYFWSQLSITLSLWPSKRYYFMWLSVDFCIFVSRFSFLG